MMAITATIAAGKTIGGIPFSSKNSPRCTLSSKSHRVSSRVNLNVEELSGDA